MEKSMGKVQDKNRAKQFGLQDKVGYMLGDLANNLFFVFISSYLMLFYTDVLGITAGSVGTMLVIARVWDGINDPMMGTFVDKRKAGPKGKFRPYLLYAALPVTIFGFLSFAVIPGIPENLKLPYAYITYIGFGMCYTAINIPYGSLASVMTTDPVERTSLSTFRTIGFVIANFAVMLLVPKLIFVDGIPNAKGFMIAAGIFVILCNLCYFGAYKLTTERVVSEQKENAPKVKFSKSLKTLLKNRPLVGIIIASFGILSSMMVSQSLTPYLFKDYFKAPELIALGGMIMTIVTLLVVPFASPLVKKFGKKEIIVGASIVGIVANLVLYIMPITNPYVFMGINFIASLTPAIFNVIIWAIVGDVIDYQEYITGNREEGIVYALYSLVRKFGQAIAGGIGGFALTFLGYQAGVSVQTPEVANGIKDVITLLPIVTTIIAFIAMQFVYNLSKSKVEDMTKELEIRRG